LHDQQGVVWVPGMRIADKVKITDDTSRCLRFIVET
jgi:hypothetical protein